MPSPEELILIGLVAVSELVVAVYSYYIASQAYHMQLERQAADSNNKKPKPREQRPRAGPSNTRSPSPLSDWILLNDRPPRIYSPPPRRKPIRREGMRDLRFEYQNQTRRDSSSSSSSASSLNFTRILKRARRSSSSSSLNSPTQARSNLDHIYLAGKKRVEAFLQQKQAQAEAEASSSKSPLDPEISRITGDIAEALWNCAQTDDNWHWEAESLGRSRAPSPGPASREEIDSSEDEEWHDGEVVRRKAKGKGKEPVLPWRG